MPSVGPQLPPSLLEKRKRSDEDEETKSEITRSRSPTPTDTSTDGTSKRQRVLGPSMPPAPLDERPISNPVKEQSDNESSSDDDDDFGPTLPTATNSKPSHALDQQSDSLPKPAPVKRDDWMMTPPSHGDWSARVDPTKLKNRKFNTGKGAKAPSQKGGADNTWHETPEEKQARLQREIMGVKDDSSGRNTAGPGNREDPHDAATAKRLEEHKRTRGPALYEAHQKSKTKELDDDPSARAFDREKDIAGGAQVNSTQRREMLKKAGDFNSRFSSAKYL